jgi:3-oxoacyl-[acyl-carrier protein] reductase
VTDPLDGIALVTGGGRGIGRMIAQELTAAGMRVAVAARTGAQVDETAREIGGLALETDVSDQAQVREMVRHVEFELGSIDLLVVTAGIRGAGLPAWEEDPDTWWRVFEINVLGAFLCVRAVLPGMIERGSGRVVIVGSGASYLPMHEAGVETSYAPSKAALGRFAELLAAQARPHGVAVFLISPGLVQTDMTREVFSDDAPWTPPELAPRLVRVLASGRADELAGRYIHAEHDDIENLIRRAEEIAEHDLNTIRLRR